MPGPQPVNSPQHLRLGPTLSDIRNKSEHWALHLCGPPGPLGFEAMESFGAGNSPLHEVNDGGRQVLGLILDRREWATFPTQERFSRLRAGMECLLQQGRVAGWVRELVVGHATFFGLVRREVLFISIQFMLSLPRHITVVLLCGRVLARSCGLSRVSCLWSMRRGRRVGAQKFTLQMHPSLAMEWRNPGGPMSKLLPKVASQSAVATGSVWHKREGIRWRMRVSIWVF